MWFSDFIQNMSQALPRCLSEHKSTDKIDYLRNPSRNFKNSICSRVLWISSNARCQNKTGPGPFFLWFNIVKWQWFVNDPNMQFYLQALVEVLKCSAYEEIPLIGRHVESLRQLRLNRHSICIRTVTSETPEVGGGRRGTCPPSFGISVNPIRTKGGRLGPLYYYEPPPHLFGRCGVSEPY